MNPWGISPAEARAMDAFIEHGCHKEAARKLGLSVKTIETHCRVARERMFQQGTGIKYLIMWDRWRQQTRTAMNDERCAA
jgi:hypothetical protein